MNDLTVEQYVEIITGLASKNTQNEITIAELQVRLNTALQQLQATTQEGADHE